MIRFRFVQDNQTDLPVKRMCELVELPRSSFYSWLIRKPSAREVADVARSSRRSATSIADLATPTVCRVCSASCAVAVIASDVTVSPG